MLILASREQAQERLEACLACPYLRPFVKLCAKCGCFVVAKTKLETAQCPEGKW